MLAWPLVASSPQALIERVAARHELDVGCLLESLAHGENALAALRSSLEQRFPRGEVPGLEVLVTGSMAKRQSTRGSDIDFFGVVDGEVPAEVTGAVIAAVLEKAVALGLDAPYTHGPSAAMVPRAEIETVHFMDDARRVFRRMTLVTASASVYRPDMRAEMMRNVLSSLIGRDRRPRVRGVVDHIIHLNRLGNMATEARMADRKPDGGLVHWAKCFTLYRVEFASALAAAFRSEIACEGRSRDDLIDDLAARLDELPLVRLLEWYDDVGEGGQEAMAAILSVSNATLRLLGRDGVRPRLAANADDEPTRRLRQEFEQEMARVGAALIRLFHHEPAFRPLTEELGLFG